MLLLSINLKITLFNFITEQMPFEDSLDLRNIFPEYSLFYISPDTFSKIHSIAHFINIKDLELLHIILHTGFFMYELYKEEKEVLKKEGGTQTLVLYDWFYKNDQNLKTNSPIGYFGDGVDNLSLLTRIILKLFTPQYKDKTPRDELDSMISEKVSGVFPIHKENVSKLEVIAVELGREHGKINLSRLLDIFIYGTMDLFQIIDEGGSIFVADQNGLSEFNPFNSSNDDTSNISEG